MAHLIRTAPLGNLPSTTPAPEISKQPAVSTDTTLFGKFDIFKELEAFESDEITIDVQSDFRFPAYYSLTYSATDIPLGYSPNNAFASTFSLTGYKMALIYCTYLYNDYKIRSRSSSYATEILDSLKTSDFYNLVLNLPVPPDTARLITQTAATHDPARHSMQYVPTLAAFDFLTDFGRTFPTTIFFAIHNILATIRRKEDIPLIVNRVLETPIITYNNVVYTITNFIGDEYTTDEGNYIHHNWINNHFRKYLHQIIGTILKDKPTLTQQRIFPSATTNATFNPYTFTMGMKDENLLSIQKIMTEIGHFIQAKWPTAKPLETILERSNGFTMLTHSIEPLTLPTWHLNKCIKATSIPTLTDLSDVEFARKSHFLACPPSFKSTIIPISKPADQELSESTDSTESTSSLTTSPTQKDGKPKHDPLSLDSSKLHLVTSKPFSNASCPFRFHKFDPMKNVYPSVLWFQPRIRRPSIASLALYLGLKIEQGNLDGSTIPTLNPDFSLVENNSSYLQGAIPLRYVRPVNLIHNGQNYYRMIERTHHQSRLQPIAFAQKDSSTVMVPIFALRNIHDPAPSIYGAVQEEIFNDPRNAFTYTAFRSDEPANIPNQYTYLWSSYRFIKLDRQGKPEIWLYYTMRTLYGISTLMHKSRNPISLLPDCDMY